MSDGNEILSVGSVRIFCVRTGNAGKFEWNCRWKEKLAGVLETGFRTQGNQKDIKDIGKPYDKRGETFKAPVLREKIKLDENQQYFNDH